MQADIFTPPFIVLGTLALCAIFFAGHLLVYRHKIIDRTKKRRSVKLLYSRFHERLTYFKQQASSLHEHAEDYVAVFDTKDWQTFSEELQNLEGKDQEIRTHLQKLQWEAAESKLLEIFDHNAASNSPHYDAWAVNVRSSLKRVIHNLEVTTLEARKLSESSRVRKRKPTLVTLADVKKRFLEDEMLQRRIPR